jgi:hypothetical protein
MPFNINPEDYRARVTELGQNDADELDKYLDVIADRRAEYTSRHTEVMAMDTEDLFKQARRGQRACMRTSTIRALASRPQLTTAWRTESG